MTRQVLVDKYRPATIEEGYVFQNETLKRNVEKWIAEQEIPNIMMVGSTGCGKTTLSRILINELNLHPNDVREYNCSTVEGMKFVREVLEPWLDKAPFGEYKVVQLEEMDRLGADAQKALRAVIENATADGCRFIATANYPKNIIPELHGRFHAHPPMEALDENTALDYIINVVEKEGIIIETDDEEGFLMNHFDAHYPDLRSVLNSIESSLDGDKRIHAPNGDLMGGGDVEDWEAMWSEDGDFDLNRALQLSEMINRTNYDHFYEVMYTNSHRFPDQGKGLVLVSQYLDRAQTSANQRLHMDACLYHIFQLGDD